MKRTLILAAIAVALAWLSTSAFAKYHPPSILPYDGAWTADIVSKDAPDNGILPDAPRCLDAETVFQVGVQFGVVLTIRVSGEGAAQLADQAWSLFNQRPPIADQVIIAMLGEGWSYRLFAVDDDCIRKSLSIPLPLMLAVLTRVINQIPDPF